MRHSAEKYIFIDIADQGSSLTNRGGTFLAVPEKGFIDLTANNFVQL